MYVTDKLLITYIQCLLWKYNGKMKSQMMGIILQNETEPILSSKLYLKHFFNLIIGV
jgi:hypothetical protein